MRTALLFVSVLGPALPMLAQAADAPAASTGDEVPAEPVPDVAPKPGWEVALLSPNPALERELGFPLRMAARTTNGGIPVRIMVGQVPAGARSKPREATHQ